VVDLNRTNRSMGAVHNQRKRKLWLTVVRKKKKTTQVILHDFWPMRALKKSLLREKAESVPGKKKRGEEAALSGEEKDALSDA